MARACIFKLIEDIDNEPNVEPWYALVKLMMYGRPVYARANFIIPSLASEPLNPKVTLFS